MSSTVTKHEDDSLVVTMSALLAKAKASVESWRWDAQQAAAEMTRLQALGVFLDLDGTPIMPSWWERSDRPSSHYLVWPADYARRAGIPRRQRIEASDYEATEAQRQRTKEYADHKARFDRLTAQLAGFKQDLTQLAAKYDW